MYAVRILETVLMEEWMSLIFLGIAAYYDVRHRRIPLYVIISALAAALVMLLCLHHEAITGYVGGAAIGIVLLLAGRLTAEGIGYGDGLAFVVTGMLLGMRENMVLLCISLVLSAFYSIFLVICKKGNRKTAIPFLPFMLCACIVLLFCYGGERL